MVQAIDIRTSTKSLLSRGVLGGLLGGAMFGALMQMMKMIPAVAMLVKSNSISVGWTVHLGISIFFGIVFALLISVLPNLKFNGALLGAVYGMALWVVGSLVLMPARLHMPLFDLNAMAWKSLMGHMIYGGILGAVVLRGKKYN